ncbi:MAG: hypothetical protein AAGJ95_11580 [Cyanobacteria bacterium J06554_11]
MGLIHDLPELLGRDHMLFGTPEAVQQTVQNLHLRGYAEPNDWSPAISTGRPEEVMKILIKRLSVDSYRT